jgi:hypothetical protein
MKLGAVHKYPGIYLTTVENLGKVKLGNASNEVPYFQILSVLSRSFSGREKEEKDAESNLSSKRNSFSCVFYCNVLTNSIVYETRRFNSVFTRAFQ